MSHRIPLTEQAIDDFGEIVYFYENGCTVERELVSGKWNLYNQERKSVDCDQYRHDLMERHNLAFPY